MHSNVSSLTVLTYSAGTEIRTKVGIAVLPVSDKRLELLQPYIAVRIAIFFVVVLPDTVLQLQRCCCLSQAVLPAVPDRMIASVITAYLLLSLVNVYVVSNCGNNYSGNCI